MNTDAPLAKLELAHIALAECKTAMEAKQIMDVAEAARVYLARTNAGLEMVNHATEIRLLAEHQLGEFLKEMPKATGYEYGGGGTRVDGTRDIPATKTPRLEDIGITNQQSHEAQKLAAIPKPEFQERIAVAKASGGKLTKSAILHQWSPKAKAAADEADKDSQNLWKLKSTWNKTGKWDRKKFLVWIENNNPA